MEEVRTIEKSNNQKQALHISGAEAIIHCLLAEGVDVPVTDAGPVDEFDAELIGAVDRLE